ncbi:hypothetical protein EDB89DRAFT_1901131 [Lactarius sanguifluus]|nr:hypothetical protein EDB89DRAFT_1901131 [Lactarius sanguifluus]
MGQTLKLEHDDDGVTIGLSLFLGPICCNHDGNNFPTNHDGHHSNGNNDQGIHSTNADMCMAITANTNTVTMTTLEVTSRTATTTGGGCKLATILTTMTWMTITPPAGQPWPQRPAQHNYEDPDDTNHDDNNLDCNNDSPDGDYNDNMAITTPEEYYNTDVTTVANPTTTTPQPQQVDDSDSGGDGNDSSSNDDDGSGITLQMYYSYFVFAVGWDEVVTDSG